MSKGRVLGAACGEKYLLLGEFEMERRTFIAALIAGLGATFVATQAQALSGLAPLAKNGMTPERPEFGVATPEDMEKAQIEKTWWRRWGWRRWGWRRPYWRRRWYWRRRYWY
ncbi:hypothetical protein [Methylocystis sp.]|uniref:hypothetical protein n=1 Tax=Methylocystis sp. TaxID=1911079 RepID=UPI003D11CDAB